MSVGSGGGPPETWGGMGCASRIGAVTLADVRLEAKAVLRDEAAVTGVLMPGKE